MQLHVWFFLLGITKYKKFVLNKTWIIFSSVVCNVQYSFEQAVSATCAAVMFANFFYQRSLLTS